MQTSDREGTEAENVQSAEECKRLIVLSWNVRSLMKDGKVEELMKCIGKIKWDIILLTELFLNSFLKLDLIAYSYPEFSFFVWIC